MMNEEIKKKYKIVFDRPNCIGAAACVTVYPERWALNKVDGLADLIGSKRIDENGKEFWILEFTEEELQLLLDSADVCPVQVITIFDVDTGKRIK